MQLKSARNGEIDVLRFVFSIIIVLHHFDQTFPIGMMKDGYIAVEFFFMVTGFLMVHSLHKLEPQPKGASEIADATWRFVFRKIKRRWILEYKWAWLFT